MKVTRIHNEWFTTITKSKCPCGRNCKDRASQGLELTVYSWGEYVHGSWRTIAHFCQGCFQERVVPRIVQHASGCGCVFKFQGKHCVLPTWLTAPVECMAA